MAKKRKRRPLLQRAALHAVKTLVREHPGVALSVAGAGAGYAIKSVAAEARDMAAEAAETVKDAVSGGGEAANPHRAGLDERACKDWLAGLSRRERAALRAFAEKHRGPYGRRDAREQ